MAEHSPIIMWFRRDLRLGDHPALAAACASGGPIVPLFILDPIVEGQGAAPQFRLEKSIAQLAQDLEELGSKLTLRRGDAITVLQDMIKETGADTVYWSRLYDPENIRRDTQVKDTLKRDGIDAKSFEGHVLFEPWTVQTNMGGYYKVFTPMWKTVRDRHVPNVIAAPLDIQAPHSWPQSDDLADWKMGAAMRRGGPIVAGHCVVGEAAARNRLSNFADGPIADYVKMRDIPSVQGTSRLSENLTYGEISPRQCWHAGMRAMHEGKLGAETFLKELVWREFAYHLAYHSPRIIDQNWREKWDTFPWKTDGESAEVLAWKQGRTGIPFVDAAMREMYVTGTMHNRARMIVASYLTKHLMTHWKIGQKWFEECLIDWDPASNAMGWQWSAGSGPDSTPFFRVFNPETQIDKFDPTGSYQRAWIAEGFGDPSATALSYFDAIPERWAMRADGSYPAPIVTAKEGRNRALSAYESRDF